jgi:hypothetical protein
LRSHLIFGFQSLWVLEPLAGVLKSCLSSRSGSCLGSFQTELFAIIAKMCVPVETSIGDFWICVIFLSSVYCFRKIVQKKNGIPLVEGSSVPWERGNSLILFYFKIPVFTGVLILSLPDLKRFVYCLGTVFWSFKYWLNCFLIFFDPLNGSVQYQWSNWHLHCKFYKYSWCTLEKCAFRCSTLRRFFLF